MHVDDAELDDPEVLARRDSRDTLRALATAGAQVREAVHLTAEAAAGFTLPERPRSVVVSGLGGSLLVPSVIELLAEPGSPVPVSVCRGLPLPGWVGPMDLVISVTLSGYAQGPVQVAAEAGRRGAELLTVGHEDSPLAEVAHRYRGFHVGVGEDRTSTRTSLWSLLTPVVLAMDALGVVDAEPSALAEVADRLDAVAEACRPGSEHFVNPAKVLALQLAGTVPVVLGDGVVSGVAAARAAHMLARTARVPATWGVLPHAASQIVSTFDGPFTAGAAQGTDEWARGSADIFADPFLDGPAMPQLSLLMINDVAGSAPGPQEELAEAVVSAARDAGVRVATLDAEPGHPLTRLAGQIAHVDFATTYLALALGLDPHVSRHVADLRRFEA